MKAFYGKLTWEKWVTPRSLQLTQLNTIARTSYPPALYSHTLPHTSMGDCVATLLSWIRELIQLRTIRANFWRHQISFVAGSVLQKICADSTYFGKEIRACKWRTNCLYNTFLVSGQSAASGTMFMVYWSQAAAALHLQTPQNEAMGPQDEWIVPGKGLICRFLINSCRKKKKKAEMYIHLFFSLIIGYLLKT